MSPSKYFERPYSQAPPMMVLNHCGSCPATASCMTTMPPPRFRNFSSRRRWSGEISPASGAYMTSTSVLSSCSAVGKFIEPSAFAPRSLSRAVHSLRKRGWSCWFGPWVLAPARMNTRSGFSVCAEAARQPANRSATRVNRFFMVLVLWRDVTAMYNISEGLFLMTKAKRAVLNCNRDQPTQRGIITPLKRETARGGYRHYQEGNHEDHDERRDCVRGVKEPPAFAFRFD